MKRLLVIITTITFLLLIGSSLISCDALFEIACYSLCVDGCEDDWKECKDKAWEKYHQGLISSSTRDYLISNCSSTKSSCEIQCDIDCELEEE